MEKPSQTFAESTLRAQREDIIRAKRPNQAANHQILSTEDFSRMQKKSSTPQQISDTSPISLEERLKRAQEKSIREIQERLRNKGCLPTTSLEALGRARSMAKAQTVSPLRAFNLAQVKEKSLSGPNSTSSYHRQWSVDKDPIIHPADSDSKFLYRKTATTVKDARASLAYHSEGPSPEKKGKKTNSRWATPDELRPIYAKIERGSNNWGSVVPSDVSTQSNDSNRAIHHGKLFKNPPACSEPNEMNLAGWDGKIQCPPVDWNDRPRFNNNTPEKRNDFNNWALNSAGLAKIDPVTNQFRAIPAEFVSKIDLHADGFGFVERNCTVNAANVSKYGYKEDVGKHCNIILDEEFEEWGKLDLSDPQNRMVQDETTELLVKGWLACYQVSDKPAGLGKLRQKAYLDPVKYYEPPPNPNKPIANIYLRPAVKKDIKQMTEIYNWYIENSPRTCETRTVDINIFRDRYDSADADKLPFIVAVLKNGNKKGVKFNYDSQMKEEKVVGFACAAMFTAADYAEHISAEVEVYVDKEFLRQGIARCLLDRLMCSTDRGHVEKGGYPWHCAPSSEHWFTAGGARDLHKIVFVIRHFTNPSRHDTTEDGFIQWLKKWLVEKWDFEAEACLKEVGTKDGRFLNITYLAKTTRWRPVDGRVPGPYPMDHNRFGQISRPCSPAESVALANSL